MSFKPPPFLFSQKNYHFLTSKISTNQKRVGILANCEKPLYPYSFSSVHRISYVFNIYIVLTWSSKKAWPLITIFATGFILLFFFPLFLWKKRKGGKNNQSRGQKSCLSARSCLFNINKSYIGAYFSENTKFIPLSTTPMAKKKRVWNRQI